MSLSSFSSVARRAAGSRGRSVAAVASVALGLAFAGPVSAALVINSGDPLDPDDDVVLDVDAIVGNGVNTSYVVVDFGATGGDSYAFGRRWNPGDDARGYTMLLAVAAETGLDWSFGGEDGVGFGVFTLNFAYPDEGELGDPDAFWAYWTAEPDDIDPGVAWTFSDVGASDRMLSDGSLDGWYNGFDGTEPSVPVIPAAGVLPLLGLAGLTRGGRSRRRRGVA